MMRRWAGFLSLWLLLALPACGGDAAWPVFARNFIDPQGRVIDTANQGVSHSEGQGYGMLLAETNADRAAFDRLWHWTRVELGVRGDALFAWKWTPENGGHVADRNNASDGDLLIAWALARAGQRWGEESYTVAARAILHDLRLKMIASSNWGPLLMPGEFGFEHDGRRVVNLSYWIFPAFDLAARIDPDPVWAGLKDSGLKLLARARFGRWGLPPDWLAIDEASGSMSVATEMGRGYGYNAIRIPLYLRWAGLGDGARWQPFEAFWSAFDSAPQRPVGTDLTDDSVEAAAAPAAIAACIQSLRERRHIALPDAELRDYYPSALYLLGRIANDESAP
ncbi:glycosyl hydrolase family 8 [Paludibacterium yongneupense]|uniref:glycosyl hydrolase family 8 n=1 Tax=Paludibacterium yongneupense TaxID=400061 RepID=UPI000411A52B|nr:glycosyl hydrolase family 8 [Paludibacterium yongneupense]